VNKTLIILNPAARGGRSGKLVEKIRSFANGTEIRLTGAVGDARRMAQDGVREGFEKIVAAGGDGTLNEVLNGVVGSDVALGILPTGTMNVSAAELGIPSGDPARAWEVVERGFTREIDLPRANGQFFIQLAGAGLDAEVVRRTPVELKKSLGPLGYVLTLAQVLAGPPPKISAKPCDGPERHGCFVLIGNGRMYGGPFRLFKDACLDDGRLDVLVFKNQSHWDIVRYFQAILAGAHLKLPDIEYFQTESLQVEGPEGVAVELDGESAGELPCEFAISDRRLRVLVPERTGG
jgi:YegS/Rv2252/BmrU family lipid kinase